LGISANKFTNGPEKPIRIPLNPELYLYRNQRPYSMKARIRIWIYPLALMGMLIILAISCKKGDLKITQPSPPPPPE